MGDNRFFKLTRRQAVFIKRLRLKEGCTWRTIARRVGLIWPALGVDVHLTNQEFLPKGLPEWLLDEWRYSGNQMDGAQLCRDAEKTLGMEPCSLDD